MIQPIAISVISKLILNSDEDKHFAQQFHVNGGLSLIQKYGLLNGDQNPGKICELYSNNVSYIIISYYC